MSLNNGNGDKPVLTVEDPALVGASDRPKLSESAPVGELSTRTKLRAREGIRQNRFVILAAGAVAFALLIFAIVSAPTDRNTHKSSTMAKTNQNENPASVQKSTLPVLDSGRTVAAPDQDGQLGEQDVARTATRKVPARTPPSGGGAGSLASIPPFGEQPWQAPPYQPGMAATTPLQSQEQEKGERNTLDKSSLVFVRSSTRSDSDVPRQETGNVAASLGLGLPVGTRLRARLESSASTAVRTPVLAVIEYNYERDGQIVVPAGAKAVGQIQEADRSGYMRIQFDSLLLPDGGTVPIQAAATDLELRPIKGKVEGKNTGKNILVRSLSGIGEATALLVGHGSLNEPLSESDLIRERVSNNIGQASDEEISRMSITSRVVVAVGAGAEVYVVLEQSSKPITDASVSVASKSRPEGEGLDQLRQLMRLQQELNSGAMKNQ